MPKIRTPTDPEFFTLKGKDGWGQACDIAILNTADAMLILQTTPVNAEGQ